MHRLRALPELPRDFDGSPEVVRLLDEIRFAEWLNEDLAEFTWFIREYPRVYRYHLSNIRFRLRSIYDRYSRFHADFEQQLKSASDNAFQVAISDQNVYAIYWDFDALLNAASSALDALARVVTTAHTEHTPPNFNKLAAKPKLSEYASTFLSAKVRWVQRMKDF